VKKRYPGLTFIAIVTIIAIIFSSCKKINASTDLGGGLIPPVDNITTFDTSLTVQAFNDTFGLATDSLGLLKNDEHFLGRINNDAFFGTTNAKLYLELKPSSYPFTFLNRSDSLVIDSVVLMLDYTGTYGDTNTVQTINVNEMPQSGSDYFKSDSNYRIRQNNFPTVSTLLGFKTFAPKSLRDSVKAFGGDTTANQLRIKLDNSFGTRLLNYDTISNSINGAYASDSAFKSKFRGFALQSVGSGNALMGFNLAGVNTKLGVSYKYHKNNPVKYDTTVAYFTFGSLSASANYVKRDYSGTPALVTFNGTVTPDPVVYIQATPGTFATIKIPDLATLSNRVIHRAELVMEQIYDGSDTVFPAPNFLYLDAIDPSIASGPKFRTIPIDVGFISSNELNLTSFGVVPVFSTDAAGNKIRTWHFNVSRYVQHILTHTQSLYDLRLFAPVYIAEQLGTPPGTDQLTPVNINTTIARGRVRLGGGSHPTQKMRLRIIYSKL
jgi:hypothetical protein